MTEEKVPDYGTPEKHFCAVEWDLREERSLTTQSLNLAKISIRSTRHSKTGKKQLSQFLNSNNSEQWG